MKKTTIRKVAVKAAMGSMMIAGSVLWGGTIGTSEKCSRYFADDAGKTWVPVGCNICFDRLQNNSQNARKLYDGWMTEFAKNGGNFMRLWLSTPFLEVMPEKPGVFSEEATENLKWLVARAEALGIKLKFTFENFRAVGDYTDRDPANGVVSFRDPVYAAFAKNQRDVFTKQECYDLYLSKARHIANAVGKSDALIAVELWNEINTAGPRDAVKQWSRRMLADLKKLFPGKMTLTNLGSFSEQDGWRIYDDMALQEGNDFMQVHRYLDPGAAMDVCRGPMDVLCADSIRELTDRRGDVPAILAETGAVESKHSGPSHFYKLDRNGLLLHDEIFAPFFAGSAGSGHPWHWDHQYISNHKLWYHFKRFATAIEGIDPAAEDFRAFHTETHRLRLWGLRGKNTVIVWMRDKLATREDMLERGVPAPTVSNFRLPFDAKTYECYLPWQDKSVTVTNSVMPDFTISAVVRFARR